MWTYPSQGGARMEGHIERHAGDATVLVLRSRAEMADFLDGLPV